MHYISANVKKLMEHLNLSMSEFARNAGVSKATISRWFSEEKTPRLDMIEKIASAYNVPLDYFIDDSFTEYWKLTDAGWVEKTDVQNEPTYEVSAGYGRLNEGYERTSSNTLNTEHITVRICGDSMYPSLHDGDMVKVIPAKQTDPQDYTVVKINGDEATCKHVEITDTGLWLRGENPDAYTDRFYTVQEVLTLPIQIIGKVVSLERTL